MSSRSGQQNTAQTVQQMPYHQHLQSQENPHYQTQSQTQQQNLQQQTQHSNMQHQFAQLQQQPNSTQSQNQQQHPQPHYPQRLQQHQQHVSPQKHPSSQTMSVSTGQLLTYTTRYAMSSPANMTSSTQSQTVGSKTLDGGTLVSSSQHRVSDPLILESVSNQLNNLAVSGRISRHGSSTNLSQLSGSGSSNSFMPLNQGQMSSFSLQTNFSQMPSHIQQQHSLGHMRSQIGHSIVSTQQQLSGSTGGLMMSKHLSTSSHNLSSMSNETHLATLGSLSGSNVNLAGYGYSQPQTITGPIGLAGQATFSAGGVLMNTHSASGSNLNRFGGQTSSGSPTNVHHLPRTPF